MDGSYPISIPKKRALLVYLAVENEHPQQRSHLAGLLWSDLSEEQAMHSLRQSLSSLRKIFEIRRRVSRFY
jgi:DNA-binding SARP family transcriptional activator